MVSERQSRRIHRRARFAERKIRKLRRGRKTSWGACRWIGRLVSESERWKVDMVLALLVFRAATFGQAQKRAKSTYMLY